MGARLGGLGLAALVLCSCGDLNIRGGLDQGLSVCADMGGQFYFSAVIPPWKYNKEYVCSQYEGMACIGTWSPTGRYVFVVSDEPFVNYDSEIVTSFDVEVVSGTALPLANALIATEQIGVSGSRAQFYGTTTYPLAITAAAGGALGGQEILWTQERTFQGNPFLWYRRDVFLESGGRVYHLRFFSIDTLDKPEFDAILGTFRAGAAPGGAPDCPCRDEHDPAGAKDC
jgi:hypothetical protein